MPLPSPDAGDLTDLASVEAFLSLPAGNADESLLQTIIIAASAEMVTYCERNFMTQAYSEVRNGNGQDSLSLINALCTSVQSLSINTIAIQPATDALGSGYAF